MDSANTDLKLIIVGSPEAGKAITIGSLLYKVAESSGNLQALHQQAQTFGFDQQDPAWILDLFKDQKENDPNFEGDSTLKITTAKNQIKITEVSGHENFAENLITRLPALDVALLVVSAKAGEFEASIAKEDLLSQDILLASSFVAKNIIVAVNKIDGETQATFEEIQGKVSERITKITGLESSRITFVPVSAKNGDNIAEKSANLAWYEGPTLLQAFEGIPPAKKLSEKPLRIPLSDFYKIAGGIVPFGRIESGTFKLNSEICFAPADVQTKVTAFETISGGITNEAPPGYNMGFSVEKKIKIEDLKKGYVCGELKNDPPRETLSFEALVSLTNDTEKIEKGSSIIIDIHTAKIACEIAEIKQKINKKDGSIVKRNPELLEAQDFALIKFVPKEPLSVDTFSEYSTLGRFALRSGETQIGTGIVSSVEKKALAGAETDAAGK